MPTDTTPAHFEPAAPPAAPVLPAETKFEQPWLTYGILFVLAAVYGCELRFGVNPTIRFSPSVETLVALGGLNRSVMEATNEWYRFFTATLLHGSPTHLLFNAVALFFAGAALEKLVGRAWYFAFFSIGALGGWLMSFVANPPDITAVGASGALMALFTALFVSSFHLPHGPRRIRIQVESMRILVPSLLPLASSMGEHIDFGCHLGGALTGAAMAYVLLKTWPAEDYHPPYQGFAGALTGLALVGFLFSTSLVYFNYPGYIKKLALLIPESEIPKEKSALRAKSAELLRNYPQDPRAHIFRAEAFIDQRDLISARFELEQALVDSEKYRFMYGLRMSNVIRVMLAGIWIDNGAKVEARKIVQPVCHANPLDRPDDKILEFINKFNLCD